MELREAPPYYSNKSYMGTLPRSAKRSPSGHSWDTEVLWYFVFATHCLTLVRLLAVLSTKLAPTCPTNTANGLWITFMHWQNALRNRTSKTTRCTIRSEVSPAVTRTCQGHARKNNRRSSLSIGRDNRSITERCCDYFPWNNSQFLSSVSKLIRCSFSSRFFSPLNDQSVVLTSR